MENNVNNSSDYLLKFINDCYEENSISHVMDTAYKYLGNPCTLHDNNYRSLAYRGKASEEDKLFSETVKNEYLSKEVINYFTGSGVLSKDLKPLYPVFNPTIHPKDKFTSKRIGIAIPSLDNTVCGWFAVYETDRDINETDVYITSWLAKILGPYLDKKDNGHKLYKVEDIFIKLLDRTIDPDVFLKCIETLNLKLSDKLRILTITTKDEIIPDPISVVIRSVLEKEDILVNYKNNIVVLIDSSKALNIAENLKNKFTNLGLLISISQEFKDVNLITHCYTQNLECLKIGANLNPESDIYRFEDYTSELLLRFAGKHLNLSEYENPVLRKIREYDKDNRTEYYESLRVLTLYGNNMKRAAAELDIHRNTLNYRMNMISKLFNIDLYNQETILKLHLSFAINECQKL